MLNPPENLQPHNRGGWVGWQAHKVYSVTLKAQIQIQIPVCSC